MNGLFLLKDGRLLGAESAGKRVVAVLPDGRVTPLATGFDGKAFRSPNDLLGDKKGGIYFTDPAPRLAAVSRPRNLATSITFVATATFSYSTIRFSGPMALR